MDKDELSEEVNEQDESISDSQNSSRSKGKWFYVFLVSVLFVFVLISLVSFLTKEGGNDVSFAGTYSFVPPELSKSASIPITIPAGVEITDIDAQVTFLPELFGSWQSDSVFVNEVGNQVFHFKPDVALDPGAHITVSLLSEAGEMSGTFLVTDDPAVRAVFPVSSNDVHEATTITIVFNRPMIPLTTLSEVEALDIPIENNSRDTGKIQVGIYQKSSVYT